MLALSEAMRDRVRAKLIDLVRRRLPQDAARLDAEYRATRRGGEDDRPAIGLGAFVDDALDAADALAVKRADLLGFCVLTLAAMDRLEPGEPEVFAYARRAWSREGEGDGVRMAILERHLRQKAPLSAVAAELAGHLDFCRAAG